MNNKEIFMTELRALGFKPEVHSNGSACLLTYQTAFYLTGNYRQNALDGLHDLLRLVETDIEKVETMNYPG